MCGSVVPRCCGGSVGCSGRVDFVSGAVGVWSCG